MKNWQSDRKVLASGWMNAGLNMLPKEFEHVLEQIHFLDLETFNEIRGKFFSYIRLRILGGNITFGFF